MKQMEKPMAEANPLDALNIGMDDDPNVDMFVNLQNIEYVEMSTDSSNRKRCAEGEEATSREP